MTIHQLILASSSAYRRALIDKLGISCEQLSPDVDESPLAGEPPEVMAVRLSELKASTVAASLSLSTPWVIVASDQVCHLDGLIYRKPGNHPVAVQHLRAFSGNSVTFSTAITLLDYKGRHMSTVEDYKIRFRHLEIGTIENYLNLDKPYDCAGAIKVEAAGVSLLDGAEGRDINSLYGLPIMAMVDLLGELGLSLNNFK